LLIAFYFFKLSNMLDDLSVKLYFGNEQIRYVVIFNRQELASALASPEPTSTNGGDGPVTGPMVVKTNTGCEDEYCCCPCHEKKDNTPPATPPPPPSDPTPPPSGILHALPALRRVYDVRVLRVLFATRLQLL
jgi:hypothetical protein